MAAGLVVVLALGGVGTGSLARAPAQPRGAASRWMYTSTRRGFVTLPLCSPVLLVGRAALADGKQAVVAPDGRWSFTPGGDFQPSPAILKTHADEVRYAYKGPRAADWKYFRAGVTVDPVRIDSLAAFDTAAGVGERVTKVERAKDGNIDVVLEDARDDKPYYRLRYVVESAERGKKRYVSRIAVADNKLVVLTVEGYVRYWDDDVEQLVSKIVDSFEVAGAK